MKLFEVRAPDGRILRLPFASLKDAQEGVIARYEVVAEVFGANANGEGGYSIPIGGPSLMAIMLKEHGTELLTWLRREEALNELCRLGQEFDAADEPPTNRGPSK